MIILPVGLKHYADHSASSNAPFDLAIEKPAKSGLCNKAVILLSYLARNIQRGWDGLSTARLQLDTRSRHPHSFHIFKINRHYFTGIKRSWPAMRAHSMEEHRMSLYTRLLPGLFLPPYPYALPHAACTVL
jgi:hypothetical protein